MPYLSLWGVRGTIYIPYVYDIYYATINKNDIIAATRLYKVRSKVCGHMMVIEPLSSLLIHNVQCPTAMYSLCYLRAQLDNADGIHR